MMSEVWMDGRVVRQGERRIECEAPPGPRPRLLCTWEGSGRSVGQVVIMYRPWRHLRSSQARSFGVAAAPVGWWWVGRVGRSPRPRRRRGARAYGQGRTPTPLRWSYRHTGARTATHL